MARVKLPSLEFQNQLVFGPGLGLCVRSLQRNLHC